MLRLYDREECPQCARVRRFLANHDITYELHAVPRLHSERTEVLGLTGLDSSDVPVLVDGERVIQGDDEIIAWLSENHASTTFGDPRYGITRRLTGVSYGDAIGMVKEALATEGFGVLTEIDVKATLKKKLDVDRKPYIILGACNPPLAHQALEAEPAIGLLLPCNVVVAEEDDGSVMVSAIDAKAMFRVLGRDDIEPLADEVRTRLRRVLASL